MRRREGLIHPSYREAALSMSEDSHMARGRARTTSLPGGKPVERQVPVRCPSLPPTLIRSSNTPSITPREHDVHTGVLRLDDRLEEERTLDSVDHARCRQASSHRVTSRTLPSAIPDQPSYIVRRLYLLWKRLLSHLRGPTPP